jgi:FtsZ-interacting cell division protein ZipA
MTENEIILIVIAFIAVIFLLLDGFLTKFEKSLEFVEDMR